MALQLIRVIRASAPPSGVDAVEDAYRLSIDEIPVQSTEEKTGIQFALGFTTGICPAYRG